jgi:hypothetical protein
MVVVVAWVLSESSARIYRVHDGDASGAIHLLGVVVSEPQLLRHWILAESPALEVSKASRDGVLDVSSFLKALLKNLCCRRSSRMVVVVAVLNLLCFIFSLWYVQLVFVVAIVVA